MTTIVLAAGCTTESGPAGGTAAPTSEPATTTGADGNAALSAYAEFWRVAEEARAAPGSRDWRSALSAVATGQALMTVLADIENDASLPAHAVGPIRRDPRIASTDGTRVAIIDCLDITDRRLVSDTSGQAYDDLAHRVVRYRYRAEVARDGTGRWLVEQTAPLLDEPC